jgi:hypothetical protein
MTRWCVALAVAIAAVCAAIRVPTSSGQTPAKDDYEFVPDTDRRFAFYRNGFVMVGKLDARGNFIQEKRYRSDSVPEILGCTPVRYEESTKVYEFRSGRLIKGGMLPTGVFVPEGGSKVTAFSDYRYGPGAMPIWNLPGYFKRAEKAPEPREK